MSHTLSDLQSTIQFTLDEAKRQGATSAEAGCQSSTGLSVEVRAGAVDSLEHHADQSLQITVYRGQSQGSSSTVDLHPDSIRASVKAALEIAAQTEPDPCNGLADPALMATHFPDLDLYHHWDITPKQAISMAMECEALARASDTRITNSDGTSLATQESIVVYGNSHGFLGGYPHSEHTLSCSLIGQEGNGEMQREGSYTVACDPHDLFSIERLAQQAAKKVLSHLNPRSLTSCRVPVIFEAEVARGLIGHFVAAMSGGAIYRKTSFLCDKLGQKIFPSWMQMAEKPHLLKGVGSSPFDSEGLLTRDNVFVKNGSFSQYALGSYSARKLGLTSTANAGGVHNLIVSHSEEDLEKLLAKMNRGLLVTDVMGQGVNITTGDYSRGVSGFWVEHGVIQYPVHQITIANNLAAMFAGIVAIANDVDKRGNILTGSILVDEMMVAGH